MTTDAAHGDSRGAAAPRAKLNVPGHRCPSEVWKTWSDPFEAPLPGIVPYPDVFEDRGYRFLKPPELPQLFELHELVWGSAEAKSLRQRWDWLMNANPHRCADWEEMVVPARVRKGRVESIQICLPQTFRVRGRPWRIYLSGALSAHPESQGSVVKLWQTMRRWPVPMWGQVSDAITLYKKWFRGNDYWSFDSDQSFDPVPFGPPPELGCRPVFLYWPVPTPRVRLLNLQGIVASRLLSGLASASLQLADRAWTRLPRAIRCRRLTRLPRALDPWLDQVMDSYPLILERSTDYLNWRFADCPQARYKIFLVENSEPLGYAVVETIVGPRGTRRWEISDLLVRRGDSDALSGVLRGLLQEARAAGVEAISSRDPEDETASAVYRNLGFISRGSDDRHVIFWDPPAPLDLPDLAARSSWPVRPADADHRLV